MNALASSWRRSLAAVAMVAILGPVSGDVAADDDARDPDASVERPLPPDGVFFVMSDDDDAPPAEELERQLKKLERALDKAVEAEHEKEAARIEREIDEIMEMLEDLEEECPEEPDVEPLLERLEELEHARDKAAEAGREKQVARIEREIDEIQEKLDDIEEECADDPEERDVEPLIERLEELERAHEKAVRAGHGKEAARIEREAREIMETLDRRHSPCPDRPDMRPLIKRLEELEREIAEAVEADREEEVEALKREAHGIAKLLERGGRPGPPRMPDDDIARRMRHVHMAADNLRAAGFPEQAERLIHDAECALREQHERERRPQGPPPGPGVEELREEVQQMRREMHEMREQLEELLKRERNAKR